MVKRLNIPDEFHRPFQRLLRLLFAELRDDTYTRNIVWVYLKLGGEKLARHGIAIINGRFREEMQEEAEDYQESNSEMDISEDPHIDAEPYSETDDLDDNDSDDDPLD